MGAEKSLKSAENIFLALLVIGLIGILFLIIFGNLAGNLGFDSDTTVYVNETPAWLNQTGYTLTGFALEGYLSSSIDAVWNGTHASKGFFNLSLPAANYSFDSDNGLIINGTGVTYTNVSVSYTVAHKSVSELNTDKVVGNLTSGATEFFTFSNVWFILTAITILLGIVLGVISLVRKTGGGKSGSRGRSEFVG